MSKRVILITGASSGIGFHTARLAAERGHTVIATAPREDLLASTPSNAALRLVIDICDVDSIRKALAQLSGRDLDCLINNAGYAQPGPIELVSDEQLRRQFDVNVFGTLSMTRETLPLLRAQTMRGQDARIITLSSMLGRMSLPFQGAYAASKHALEAAFEALRMELHGSGIRVSLIEPGWIATEFLRTAMALAPPSWLTHKIYGKALSAYFAVSRQAESANPSGAAKIAASLAGTPEQVAKVVLRAVESSSPRPRYPATAMASWMPRFAGWTPTKIWDDAMTKQYRT